MSKDIEKSDSPGLDELPGLVDQLPPEGREILKEALNRSEDNLPRTTAIFSAYSGPLPPPDQLGAYQNIDREFPGRIMAMAEKEQSHRHAMEDRALQSTASFERLGQLCTLLISGAVIAIGALIALKAHAVAGSIVAAVPLASLAAQLISGRRIKRRKNEQQETG